MGDSFIEAMNSGWEHGARLMQDAADFQVKQEALRQAAALHQMQMAKYAQDIIQSQRDMQYDTQMRDEVSKNPTVFDKRWGEGFSDYVKAGGKMKDWKAPDRYTPENLLAEKLKNSNAGIEEIQAATQRAKSPTGVEYDEKYRTLIQRQTLGEKLPPGDQAYIKAYEKQKTLSAAMPVYTITPTDKGLQTFQTKGAGAGNFVRQDSPLPQAKETPEAAAKMALINQGIEDVKRANKMLFSQDGKIDRALLAKAMVSLPGTSGREFNSYIYNAIEAKLRAESGAAVPESEVKRMARRFVPGTMDNDSTIKSKMSRLNEWLGMAQTMTDPSGSRARHSGGKQRLKWTPNGLVEVK
jgi:hypothetical protein